MYNTDDGQYLEKTINHIKQWLQIHEANQRVVRPLRILLQIYELDKETYESVPDCLMNSKPFWGKYYEKEYDELKQHLPLNKRADFDYIELKIPTTTSSSISHIYDTLKVVDYESNNIFKVTDWMQSRINSYNDIIRELNLCDKIKERIIRLNQKLLDEFNKMEDDYYSVGDNSEKTVSAGISMRNVLERYKGVLFEKARNKNEQKIKWSTMVERLTKHPTGSLFYNQLLDQEEEWKLIHKELTYYAKNKKNDISQLQEIWFRLLIHFSVVLLLVNI